MQVRNISPVGGLDVPLLGLLFAAGQVLDVTHDQAALLLVQPPNFEPADDDARALLAALEA